MKYPAILIRARDVAVAVLFFAAAAQAAPLKTKNVFLIISDGFRWQEVFTGAELDLMNKENGGVPDTNSLQKRFWRETPEARREALLPFFWNDIAKKGQIYGNRTKGSDVSVTNGKKFSYPGYSEIITGFGDPRIDSNDKKPNPNMTVFEWLNEQEGLQGKVSVLGTWDVFPFIFNIGRSHLPIWPTWQAQFKPYQADVSRCTSEVLHDTTAIWGDLTYDGFLYQAVTSHIAAKHPRLVFIGFGETDEWAHEGRYDQYLNAAHLVDDFVKRLWEMAQSTPEYRDQTTIIVTADHGRGSGPHAWRDHGEKVDGAEADWIAVIGPDTAPLGERTNIAPVTQSQIAATIAALLGQDYHQAVPKSGAPIEDILSGKGKTAEAK